MFDLDQFIADCKAALREGEPTRAAEEVVKRAVADPAAVIAALGEPRFGGVDRLYNDDDLTILNLRWYPGQDLLPHNHNMWAVIGLFTGREDNTFWRSEQGQAVKLGGKTLEVGEVGWLGETAIHSVKNPTDQVTAALHVYGGNFFAPGRSEWDKESLRERPYDMESNIKSFELGNAALAERYAAEGR
ncbi:MAG: cysteine dioxygenase family protein [Pseudomonadota bacterium]|nr:cysteine dioxygenase family protein [Pseudomonadota bacterium]MEC7673969.1 cysteine dioxygenase family protein [Pseudomonadota bacterium]MEC8027910.1 cysteine dioxygenase family protein [Pseudomonadota bacterium]MEC8053471.1 cysteine dioxygenase family protein [Pseudomonadota bacterium]MEC8083035.1 cysteine dioxygenase family protein [Pseudomonadota bacterium]